MFFEQTKTTREKANITGEAVLLDRRVRIWMKDIAWLLPESELVFHQDNENEQNVKLAEGAVSVHTSVLAELVRETLAGLGRFPRCRSPAMGTSATITEAARQQRRQ
jgi:hypothetical protein